MRRSTRILLAVIVTLSVAIGSACGIQPAAAKTTIIILTIGSPTITVNGTPRPIDDSGTTPVIVAGRTLLPIRAVVEAIGGTIAWDATTRTVTITAGAVTMSMTIGNRMATVHGTLLPIDAQNTTVVPLIVGGRTMLPVRFVGEQLGGTVAWDEDTKTATLTFGGTAPQRAAFTITPAAAEVGQAVAFTDTTAGKSTAWSWNFGDGATSTLQNPSHTYATEGTFQVTFTTSSAQGPTTASKSVAVRPKAPGKDAGGNQYSIEQAISDNAQLNTLAFGALGFLTGNTGTDSFLPPGKVADFFGFQYLRDTTQAGQGHSTDFVTNAANNVLFTLNDAQKALMIALAKSQSALVDEFAYKRFPLMVAFRRQLDGDVPAGSSGLSKTAVMQYSADLYELDARISLQRAQLFGDIIRSLDATQVAYLDKMVAGGFAAWPALGDQVDKKGLEHTEHVLVMTYASEMLGWYAGDVEADTYFCPERQADYFGGFYIKDAPAMGNAGYTIDESVTGNKGQEFINALDTVQKPIITSIVETQRASLYSIVEKRRAISTELRNALTTGIIDESKVLSLAREYGELDGEISYYYATGFAQVGKTLTTAQTERLMAIRDLDDYPCPEGKAYLYSERIDMPAVGSTDFFFAAEP